MTAAELQDQTAPGVDVEIRGKSTKLFKAAALFASGLAATAAMMGPGNHKIADVIGDMQARGDQARQAAPPASSPVAMPMLAIKAAPAPAPLSLLNETDRARVQILSRPVPSDTKAAAEISRAIPLPKDSKVQLPSAEQTKVLSYGQFAPIAARVFNNATKQKETHWTLHPWDVARLADQASAELYKESRIRVEPRLIAGAYYTESSGVVQIGFDRKGVEMLNKGKSIEEVVKSESKASFGLFQIDQQHAGAGDLDPLRGAKRAAEFLAEGQDNVRRYPHLGMLAVSATYNASTNLRAKIFTGAELDARELEAFESVRNHAASMSNGAALYDVAHRTYKQHLAQAQKAGIPVAVAADSALKRTDPLKDERVGAVFALTGRQFQPSEQIRDQAAAAEAAHSVPATSAASALNTAEPAQAPAAATPVPKQAVASRASVLEAMATPAAAKAKPSLRDAIQPASSAASRHTEPPATASGRRSAPATTVARAPHPSQRAAGPQSRPGGLQVIGGPAWQQPPQHVVPERAIVVNAHGAPAERAKAALDASVSDWKNGASAMLGRVADFHQRRTREMAAEREAP